MLFLSSGSLETATFVKLIRPQGVRGRDVSACISLSPRWFAKRGGNDAC